MTTPRKRPPPRVLASPLIKAQTAPARAPPPRHLSAGGSGGGVGVQRGADRSGVRSGTPRKPVFATPPTSPEAAADVTSGQRGEAPARPSVLTRAAQIVVFLLWLLLLGPLIVCSWMGLGRFVGESARPERAFCVSGNVCVCVGVSERACWEQRGKGVGNAVC